MTKPFDGAISAFAESEAPEHIRKTIARADKDDMLSDSYPHSERMSGKAYDKQMERLQIELVKMQAWVQESGARVACVFEGRDAAGKGGTQTFSGTCCQGCSLFFHRTSPIFQEISLEGMIMKVYIAAWIYFTKRFWPTAWGRNHFPASAGDQ